MKVSAAVHSLLSSGILGRVLIVFRRDDHGNYEKAAITFKPVPANLSFSIDDDENIRGTGLNYGCDDEVTDFLQAMADCAWENGIRPRGLEDSRQELKAVRDHLQDMRQLAGITDANHKGKETKA